MIEILENINFFGNFCQNIIAYYEERLIVAESLQKIFSKPVGMFSKHYFLGEGEK